MISFISKKKFIYTCQTCSMFFSPTKRDLHTPTNKNLEEKKTFFKNPYREWKGSSFAIQLFYFNLCMPFNTTFIYFNEIKENWLERDCLNINEVYM